MKIFIMIFMIVNLEMTPEEKTTKIKDILG